MSCPTRTRTCSLPKAISAVSQFHPSTPARLSNHRIRIRGTDSKPLSMSATCKKERIRWNILDWRTRTIPSTSMKCSYLPPVCCMDMKASSLHLTWANQSPSNKLSTRSTVVIGRSTLGSWTGPCPCFLMGHTSRNQDSGCAASAAIALTKAQWVRNNGSWPRDLQAFLGNPTAVLPTRSLIKAAWTSTILNGSSWRPSTSLGTSFRI